MDSHPSEKESDILTKQEFDEILSNINQIGGFALNVFGAQTPALEECQPDVTDDRFSSTGLLPATDEFTGLHEFKLFMNKTDPARCSWTYSESLKQAFIDMNKVLMVSFQVKSPEKGMYIRAVPVYTSDEHAAIPVVRCRMHFRVDDPVGQAHTEDDSCCCLQNSLAGHVVRVATMESIYCYSKTSMRHSVMVPVVTPQPGTNCIQVPYIFSCKTSCFYGMQRRPIQVIFTLEKSGIVVGRQVLAVKICSCPKRDMEKMLNDLRLQGNPNLSRKRSKPKPEKTTAVKRMHLEVQVTPHLNYNEKKQARLKAVNELINSFTTALELLERLRSLLS